MTGEVVRHLPATSRVRRAGIYVRLSQDRAGAGIAIGRQEVECRDLAERRGWSVSELYADNDTGAFAGKRRPGYERLLADLRSGAIDAVVCWHVDRLTRRPLEMETFVDLCERLGAEMGTVQGEIDLGTPAGRLFARQLGAFARYEQEHKAERIRSTNRTTAYAGKMRGGGMRCFGYERDGTTVREEEARVLRELAQRTVEGESLRSLVTWLNQAGWKTTTGRQWQAVSLKRLLSNPRLIGKRTYLGEVVADGDWQAILEPAVQEKVKSILWSPERTAAAVGRSGRHHPRKYLLGGGLLVCSLCGSPLHTQPGTTSRSGEKKRGYICRSGEHYNGCGRMRIAADALEVEVAARVLSRLSSPSIRKRLQAANSPGDETGDTLAAQILELESKLDSLGRDYGDGLIGRTAFMSAQTRMLERIAEARSALAGVARLQQLPAADPSALAAWWDEATVERRRDLIATVIDHIVVGPATRRGPGPLDEDRLTWLWR